MQRSRIVLAMPSGLARGHACIVCRRVQYSREGAVVTAAVMSRGLDLNIVFIPRMRVGSSSAVCQTLFSHSILDTTLDSH